MMLKTSSREINPFWGMLKFTLRKNLGIIIIVTIAALLYCPGHFLTDFEYYIGRINNGNYSGYDMLQDFMYIVSVVAGILVTFFNFINFTYLYGKRSSDVFHAFPLKRSELMISRMAASVIGTLIPVTVAYIAFTALCIFNPWMMSSFAQILISYLHTLLVVLLCSSYSAVFVVSAGSMFDLGVSFIGANGALLIIAAIIDMMLEEKLIGYMTNTNGIMKALSPLYYSGMGLANLGNIKMYGISKLTAKYIIISIVYTAVFTAVSLFLYNRRKAEKGGQAYAFKYIFIVCSILAGVCGSYIVGYLFAEGDFNIIFWIFATIGAVLTCTVYGAVTNRGFKNIKTSIIIGIISALVLPSVAVTGVTGCFGYSTYIPEADKVQSATISYFSESIEFKQEDISWVNDFHSEILESDVIVTQNDTSGYQTRWIYFNYYMKDGTTVSRRFHIVQERAKNILLKLYKCEQRIDTVESALESSPANAILYIGARINEKYVYTFITRAECEQLLSCYRKDLEIADASYITDDIPYTFDLEWRDKNNTYVTQYTTLEYSQKFQNTYNYIMSLKLDERTSANEEVYYKY